ncbi:hypothetical protein SASPL_122051 [Salvia splendens]|uniref:Uncharacterized protein n=1 Tax=Salvia splendens TaxID=180675 RepID=A0A8X8XMM7_SALSN|nr:hypothetical protein SASPL_122051 [Salvia splendens]
MRGVYFKNLKWQAAIKVDKKQIHLGTVGSQEEATRLYDSQRCSETGPQRKLLDNDWEGEEQGCSGPYASEDECSGPYASEDATTCHCEPLKAQALRIVLCSFLAPISPIFEQGQDPQNSENTKLVSVHPLPLNDSLKPKEVSF